MRYLQFPACSHTKFARPQEVKRKITPLSAQPCSGTAKQPDLDWSQNDYGKRVSGGFEIKICYGFPEYYLEMVEGVV